MSRSAVLKDLKAVKRRHGEAAFREAVEALASGECTLPKAKRGRPSIPDETKQRMAWAAVSAYRQVHGETEEDAALRAIQDGRTVFGSDVCSGDDKPVWRYRQIRSSRELLRHYRKAEQRRGTDRVFQEDCDRDAAIIAESLRAKRDGVDAFERILQRVFPMND